MDKLFLEEVIYRYKHPEHRGTCERQVCKECNARDLSCGDDITLYLSIKDGVIASAKFDGSVCSIANFGADLLLDKIIGQKIEYALRVTSQDLLPKAGAGLLGNPVRLKCFELAQAALSKL
jgi:nitrogen fixation NifU-like protein